MLKLFRSLRKQELSNNKISKYLLYALGEIVLVVIGILIALTINNRNENRQLAAIEEVYLLGLQKEFQISKAKLEELIRVNAQNYEGAKQVLAYITHPEERPSEEQFSRLLYNSFAYDIAFNPNNSLLNEMMSTGTLKNLSKVQLRIQLTNWLSSLEDISRQENDLAMQRDKLLDLFRSNDYSLSTVFEHAGVYDELSLPKGESRMSNLGLLESTAFENNILMFISTSYATEKAHYEPLMKDLNAILALIEEGITKE